MSLLSCTPCSHSAQVKPRVGVGRVDGPQALNSGERLHRCIELVLGPHDAVRDEERHDAARENRPSRPDGVNERQPRGGERSDEGEPARKLWQNGGRRHDFGVCRRPSPCPVTTRPARRSFQKTTMGQRDTHAPSPFEQPPTGHEHVSPKGQSVSITHADRPSGLQSHPTSCRGTGAYPCG